MGRVGPIDITVGNAARLGASQRSTTRRLRVALARVDGEAIRQERVIQHAQNQTDYRPNENAARGARLESDDSNDAHGRKSDEDTTTRANANKDGSSSHREGEKHAARFLAETAGSSEGINPL